MLRLIFAGLILSCYFSDSYGQYTGAKFTATGGTGVAQSDVWSVTQNPAGLAWLQKGSASVNYENLYFIQNLGVKSAALALPFQRNAVGVSFQSLGFESYRELNATFAFARKFGERLSAALAFHYHQISISSYGNTSGFSFDAGLQYLLSDTWRFGLHVINPTQNQYDNKDAGSKISTRYHIGAAWQISPQIEILFEGEKPVGNLLTVRSGISYRLADVFSLRGGFNANPFSQYGGFGLAFKNLLLDVAVSAHPTLGMSPSISLGYAF